MTRVVYLNNWHREQPANRFDRALADSGFTVEEYRAPRGEFPSGVDAAAVFVGPSKSGAYDDEAWIDREHEVLQRYGAAGVPMLGICFGAQILASALVGREQVFRRGNRETGFGEVTFTAAAAADPIAGAYPQRVRTFHWHGDEVRATHPDIVVLATSAECANQLWRWRHGPVWGVQVHAEMDRAQVCEFLEQNRAWFVAEGKDVDALKAAAEDNADLADLFGRFVAHVRARTSPHERARTSPHGR